MSQSSSDNKKLGLWTSTSLVVGNMIGAGVFMMPAALASFGSISLLGWIVAAIGTFFLARIFGNLSKLLPHITGGPYAYTRSGLGDFAGFLVAWGYWLSTACANAAITISFVSAMSTFFPVLATHVVISITTGLAVIWLLSWINTRGIAVSGKLQLITTVLKLLPLILVAVGGLFFIRGSNFHPFNNTGGSFWSALNTAAAFTMFAFVGVECASIPAGNVSEPEKTIPKATNLGLIIATLVYILGSVSVMGVLPNDKLMHSVTPYADAAVLIYGSSARYWVSAGIAIAAFGALNGWILIQGQVPYAIAKDKMFPTIFAWENKRKVPYMGIVVNSVVVSLLMLMNYTKGLVDQFRFLLQLAVFTIFIPYLFSTIAYIIVRIRKGDRGESLTAAVILFVLAFVYSLWAIAGAGEKSVYYGFILLFASTPFYVWVNYKKEVVK
jgi:APA family basic amino acid/polyamine antiporter